MKRNLIKRGFVSILASACMIAVAVSQIASGQNFTAKVFTGSIDEKYPIQMTLTRAGKTFNGFYVYTKVGKPIALKGSIDDEQNVTLDEFDENGQQTGTFSGTLIGSSMIDGGWTNQAKTKERTFSVAIKTVPASVAAQTDGVEISEQTATFTDGKRGPDHKEAKLSYPVVKGDSPLLRKIQSSISLKAVFSQSVEGMRKEYKDSPRLTDLHYSVDYDQNYILDIIFVESGEGAYPSTNTTNHAVNLKTGDILKAADVFNMSSAKSLLAMVDKAMQDEIKRDIAQAAKDQDKESANAIKEMTTDKHFTIENLDHFSVNNDGITFLYDFAFPHVIKPLEPSGRYFFSYARLKSYIKRDGLLAPFNH
jgi:hypothetical protein